MKNIDIGRPGVFLFGLLLGLSVALAALAEKRTLTISQKFAPLFQSANVTQLEWSFVQARLGEVEDHADNLTETGIGSCCARYGYDPAKNKIVARFRWAPDTLNRLTVQEAKKRLSSAAIGAIGSAKYELEQQPGVKLELNDFEVDFVTWDEHAQFKTFAVYRNDQIEFVDHPLK
jgi:hypothetical protein